MKRWAALLIGAGLLLAGVVVLSLRGNQADPPAKPARVAAPVALNAEVADWVLPQVLGLLADCLAEADGPDCLATGDLRFQLVLQSGAGRIGQLEVSPDSLAPPVLRCFEARLAGLALRHGQASGELNVLFPLPCDPQGQLHLPSLAPQGKTRPVEPLPMR